MQHIVMKLANQKNIKLAKIYNYMKIVIIKNYLPPYIIGGAELNVDALINILSDKEEEIDKISVITMDKNLWPIETRISSRLSYYKFFPINLYFPYPLEKKRNKLIKMFWWILNLWNPWTFFQIVRILKKEKPDVVQLHNFYGFSISVISAIQFLKIPIVFVPHDFYLICKNSSFMKKSGVVCTRHCLVCALITHFYRLVIRKPITTFFLSDYSAQILCKYHPNLKIGAVIHNYCQVTDDIIQNNIKIREKNDLTDEQTVKFLFIGRLEKAKGILTLIDAIKLVNEKNVKFTIAGEGEYKQLVENFCNKSETTKYLGFISGDKKHDCFLSHDILIFASEWFEVSPLTILEANAYGMPVLAGNIGSVPEHILENQNGFLFSAGNSSDLAFKITELAKNKEMIINMRIDCFNYAISNNHQKYFNTMVKTLQSISKNKCA
jgi:glycosyltransferase involved in cell wall biosynthesis